MRRNCAFRICLLNSLLHSSGTNLQLNEHNLLLLKEKSDFLIFPIFLTVNIFSGFYFTLHFLPFFLKTFLTSDPNLA